MARELEIRGSRKQRLLGKCAGWLLRAVGSTLRIRLQDPFEVVKQNEGPILWAFWHNTVFVMPYVRLKHFGTREVVVLTSASKDGAVLENAVGVCKIGAVRGSSSRRAVAAVVALRNAVRDGMDVCITPDGPRGPKYELQPGIIKMAESTDAPIVPIRVQFTRAWKLRTWDAFRIPLPFSKVSIVIGEPVKVPQGISDSEFEQYRLQVERMMQESI